MKRRVRSIFAALLLGLGMAAPAQASSTSWQRVIVVPVGSYTASPATVQLAVQTFTQCAVVTVITTVSGTTPTYTVNVDVSADGGTNFVNGVVTGTAITAAGGQVLSIGEGMTNATSFGDTIRIRVVIAGTSPSFTGLTSVICK